MIFIPILIDNGHILSLTTENRHKGTEKYVQWTDDGHGVKLQLEQKKLFVYFSQRSRGVEKHPWGGLLTKTSVDLKEIVELDAGRSS